MTEDLDARLTRLFAAIRKEARANPSFADALAKALGVEVDAPSQTQRERFDPTVVYAEEGEAGLRAALADMTKPALYALVRAGDLEPRGASSFNRARLIEHVVSVVRRRAAPRRRSVFDY